MSKLGAIAATSLPPVAWNRSPLRKMLLTGGVKVSPDDVVCVLCSPVPKIGPISRILSCRDQWIPLLSKPFGDGFYLCTYTLVFVINNAHWLRFWYQNVGMLEVVFSKVLKLEE